MSFSWAAACDDVFPRDGEWIEPLSERWRQARRGRITASTSAKTIWAGRPASWLKLAEKIKTELQPGWQWREINMPALDWGRDNEGRAIASLELELGTDLIEPGLMFHPRHPFAAATPDALDGDTTIQIKCPFKSELHLNTKVGGVVPPQYVKQTQWEIWVAGARRGLFVSFDPQQPAVTQFAIIEVKADYAMHERFETNLLRFKQFIETDRLPAAQRATAKPIGVAQLF